VFASRMILNNIICPPPRLKCRASRQLAMKPMADANTQTQAWFLSVSAGKVAACPALA